MNSKNTTSKRTKQSLEWEKELENKFICNSPLHYIECCVLATGKEVHNDLVDFISSKFKTLREEVEGMKVEMENNKKDIQGIYWTEVTTKNKVINDILELIDRRVGK